MLIMTIEFFDKLTQKYSIGKDFDFCDATSYRWVFVGDNDDHQCVKCPNFAEGELSQKASKSELRRRRAVPESVEIK